MLELMLLTNTPEKAQLWDEAGVDIIFIDLEILGKENRQGHLNTVISRHSMSDISKVKPCLKKATLLVRVNPLHQGSKNEVDEVVSRGADIIMLPMFKSARDIESFLRIVDNRCEVYPLIETPEALLDIENLINIDRVSGYHIGLNDLHLAEGNKFMFEVMLSREFKYAVKKLQESNKIFGIGGVSRLGGGDLPAELILKEHFRLGSTRVILSRSFKDEVEESSSKDEILKVKKFYSDQADIDLSENEALFKYKVLQIVERFVK